MIIVDGNGPYDERFEAVYRKSYGRVWRYFRSNGVSDDESHDLAQDTFKRLYPRMGQIRNDDEWPFLSAIARTVLLNYVRARHTQKRSVTLVEIDNPDLGLDPAAPEEPDYADRQADEVQREKLRKTVESLPPGQRECLRLSLENCTYKEIAKILGISEDAVKSRLRDAKRTLREQLGDKP
ncbi:MAG TPA: RNA polymerase sigma factor [Thermoanaerobaculia bacterium]|nr:RNA polymerase sigma factor [Thermoanaerobaculia bacterium]